jgi:hypothetical protein
MTERFVNLFKPNDKEQYADVVWDMLQKSYESIGGIKGSGFRSKEDMVKNIPMWKLVRRNGEIVAGSMYKDKDGRKGVASFTNGTPEGKQGLMMIKKEDFSRAYFEMSKSALGFSAKTLGIDFLVKNAWTKEEAAKKLKKELFDVPASDSHVKKFPELVPYMYQRELGGKLETKVLFGK